MATCDVKPGLPTLLVPSHVYMLIALAILFALWLVITGFGYWAPGNGRVNQYTLQTKLNHFFH